MNIFQRNRIVIWVLAGLLLIVMSALGTMIWHQWVKPVRAAQTEQCGPGCRLLTEELGLSEQQSAAVDSIRESFKRASAVTVDSLTSKRSLLVTELSKENPDTFLLRQYAMEIGMLQADLVNRTIDQYLLISKECTPEQREKLSSLYYEIMGCCRQGEGRMMRERCKKR
jgi:Spy/CpxP family protein refolding chaperone